MAVYSGYLRKRAPHWLNAAPLKKCLGRIGSQQQLAENALLVSLGCSGGRQRLYQIQLEFYGKPELLPEQFPLHACENGVNLLHVAKHAFGDQNWPKHAKPPCRLAVPLIKD